MSEIEDALKRVPPKIAAFIGIVERRDPLDSLFFHRLIFGPRQSHVDLARKLRRFYNKTTKFELTFTPSPNNKACQESFSKF